MNLIVVRHGRTSWNDEGKIQGKTDIPLNHDGVYQANLIKEKLENEDIDLIISSPLKRARHTASIINKDRQIDIIYNDLLSERNFGEFEGKNKNDFDFVGTWDFNANKFYEKAENIVDFFDRVNNFLDYISNEYNDKNILLVTHGGVSIAIDCYFNGIPEDNDLLKLVPDNCELKKYSK